MDFMFLFTPLVLIFRIYTFLGPQTIIIIFKNLLICGAKTNELNESENAIL
jgi:hypothetical protein